jgi:hypothetical protein
VLFQAKALAEKNMRDLLTQREQAERNVKIFLKCQSLSVFVIDSFG